MIPTTQQWIYFLWVWWFQKIFYDVYMLQIAGSGMDFWRFWVCIVFEIYIEFIVFIIILYIYIYLFTFVLDFKLQKEKFDVYK